MKSYSEKLKHPKWQKKRLDILNRDEFKCKQCGSEEDMLNIHHICYDGDPWNVSDDLLITLCESCHKIETECLINSKLNVIKSIQKTGGMAYNINALSEMITNIGSRSFWSYEPNIDILEFAYNNKGIWEEISALFWEHLSNKNNGKTE